MRLSAKIKKAFPRLPVCIIADGLYISQKVLQICADNRWKIENQEFNRQKHWQGDICHACSWNERAQKNHYLMEQISDFIKFSTQK